MSLLTIASICPRMALVDPARNFAALTRWTKRAARSGAGLVFFPEMFLSGYVEGFMATAGLKKKMLKLAEPVPGPMTDQLCRLSRKLGIFICVGLLEKEGAKRFNTQVMIHPRRGLMGKFRKVHIGTPESWMAQPGTEYPIFEVKGVRIGIMICRDKSHPEAARILALEGAQLLLAPHSTTDLPDKRHTDWSLRICTVRAIENGCYLIANNNIYDCPLPPGRLPGGYSFGIDPYGKVIHCDRGRGDREKMAVITVDSKKVLERRKWEGKGFNLWTRRPKTYARLLRA